jgi:hypothetical protein
LLGTTGITNTLDIAIACLWAARKPVDGVYDSFYSASSIK